MDRRLFVASALGLLVPGAALAQGRPPGGGPGGHPGGGSGGNSGGPRPPSGGGSGGGQGPGPRPSSPSPKPSPAPRPPSGGGGRPPPRPQPAPPVGPHRPGAGRPPGFHPVPGPRWRYPPGYRYRRWTIGLVLPALFLSSTYYYEDYWRMGLEGPPWGCQWVRYGPDLLLIEVRTGRIVDVIYGAFY